MTNDESLTTWYDMLRYDLSYLLSKIIYINESDLTSRNGIDIPRKHLNIHKSISWKYDLKSYTFSRNINIIKKLY